MAKDDLFEAEKAKMVEEYEEQIRNVKAELEESLRADFEEKLKVDRAEL